jgi:uncharacterized metal-binding protein
VETYIGLLIQVPLVGVFIWFTLKIVDRFMASLDARDKQWQDFLAQQRKETNEAMTSLATRLGEEIKSVTNKVAEFNGILSAHDARQQERTRQNK